MLVRNFPQQGPVEFQLGFVNGSFFDFKPAAQSCEVIDEATAIPPPSWVSYLPFKEHATVDNISSDVYELVDKQGDMTLEIEYAVSSQGIAVRWHTGMPPLCPQGLHSVLPAGLSFCDLSAQSMVEIICTAAWFQLDI